MEKVPEIKKVREIITEILKIPEYQRPYKWKAKNVIQLLDDVWNSKINNKKSYRIGTVILHKDSTDINIVDGQQRLVTITLVLRYLFSDKNEKINLPLLHSEFPHIDSKNNIQFNYLKIQEWFSSIENHKESFKDYLLNYCEIVRIELDDISEAFQLFDSQNARGKPLQPYDLLKAFHLREMNENTEDERLTCVKNWENAVNDKMLNNLGKYLYRIRIWSRGEDADEFTKDDIGEFKGINVNRCKDYPYLKSYLMNDAIVSEMSRNSISKFFGAKVEYPFQITQIIINGKRFFEYVDFYSGLYQALFNNNTTAFDVFYENQCLYSGYHRTGDTYVREMYKALILYFTDKFGINEMSNNLVFEQLYK
jgi:uncharacterized protein with ParB-like and HNH nuclease domain